MIIALVQVMQIIQSWEANFLVTLRVKIKQLR